MELVRKAQDCVSNEDGLVFFPEECETLAVNCVRIQPGQNTMADAHPDEEEIYVILSGCGYVSLDGVQTAVEPGSAVYVPRYVHHYVHAGENTELVYVCVANWPDKPGRP